MKQRNRCAHRCFGPLQPVPSTCGSCVAARLCQKESVPTIIIKCENSIERLIRHSLCVLCTKCSSIPRHSVPHAADIGSRASCPLSRPHRTRPLRACVTLALVWHNQETFLRHATRNIPCGSRPQGQTLSSRSCTKQAQKTWVFGRRGGGVSRSSSRCERRAEAEPLELWCGTVQRLAPSVSVSGARKPLNAGLPGIEPNTLQLARCCGTSPSWTGPTVRGAWLLPPTAPPDRGRRSRHSRRTGGLATPALSAAPPDRSFLYLFHAWQ